LKLNGLNGIIFQKTLLLAVLAELISSTLKMEAMCSSETSVETQRGEPRNFTEDVTACQFLLNLFFPP
jgi:hypothetical protein